MIRSQIFALLLTVSLFCACAPSLRTTAVRSREQRDIREMAIRQEFSTRDSLFFRALCEELLRRLDSERVRNRIIGQEIETITREYDTNRPVDTLTGKPPPFDGRRSSGNALRILYARRAVYNRPSTGSEPTQHSVANIPDSKSEKPGIFHGRKLLKPPSTHNDSGALHGGGTPCASSGCWP